MISKRPTDDRLKNKPQATPQKLPTAPDGKERQQAVVTRDIHRTTVINNSETIIENVFVAPGWYSYGDIYYYNPGGGLLGVYYGDLCFWMHRLHDHWWWWHPLHRRWLCWHNGYFWYWHPDLGWYVWYDDSDTYYAVGDGSLTQVSTPPPPDQPAPPTPPAQSQDQTYPSEDGTLVVYVLGTDRSAHLYRNTDSGLEYVVKLGADVKRAGFTQASDGNQLLIWVEYKDGSVGWFDQNGDIYGSEAPPQNSPAASVSLHTQHAERRVQHAMTTAPFPLGVDLPSAQVPVGMIRPVAVQPLAVR